MEYKVKIITKVESNLLVEAENEDAAIEKALDVVMSPAFEIVLDDDVIDYNTEPLDYDIRRCHKVSDISETGTGDRNNINDNKYKNDADEYDVDSDYEPPEFFSD